MVDHRQSELIEPDTAEPTPVGADLDYLLVPAIEYAMELDVHDLPT